MIADSKDKLSATFTDSEVTIAHDMANQLEKCKPWKNHLDETAIKLFRKAVNTGDSELSRSIIEAGSKKDTAAPWCLDPFKTVAVQVCRQFPSIIKDNLHLIFD